jgi:hypothetical protein
MKQAFLAAIVAGIVAAGFSIYPQYHLWSIRGADFNGAYATYDLDETAYAAYLQALIDGRPRRNDPYTGRDDTDTSRQPESLFSIQFATAYAISFPARAFGLSSAQMMPAISILSAVLTALSLFWLIYVSGNAWMSLAGTLAVIAGGALISGIGVIGMFSEGGVAYPYLPLFRRHIPSLTFPFAFSFFASLFCGLESREAKRRLTFIAAAAGCFGVILFSYFYLWTAVLSAFGIASVLILIRPAEGRRRDAWLIIIVAVALAVLLVPYAYLLSNRQQASDATLLLVFTRQPDLLRNVEIVGIVVAAITFLLAVKNIAWLDRLRASFFVGLALSSIAVFNQQILTGRSLQPFHYEFYSVNYLVLLSAVLLISIVIQRLLSGYNRIRAGIAIGFAIAATLWGGFEVYETTVLWDDINIARDEAMPVNRRLRQIAEQIPGDPRGLVTLNLDSLQGDSQPTMVPFAVLWARHQHTFAGMSGPDEGRLRYYKQIYLSGLDADWLRRALTGCSDIEACMMLFGWDRFNPTLSSNARGVTESEIEDEVSRYSLFESSFDARSAYSPKMIYVVGRLNDPVSDRLTQWYRVGPVEQLGEFELHSLTPTQ